MEPRSRLRVKGVELMTPETLSYLAAVAAGLGLIVRELQWRNSATTPPSNGNGDNFLRRLIAEHERDCSHNDEMKRQFAELRAEYKRDFAGLERNVSGDIRGVHERLDRVIERRAP